MPKTDGKPPLGQNEQKRIILAPRGLSIGKIAKVALPYAVYRTSSNSFPFVASSFTI